MQRRYQGLEARGQGQEKGPEYRGLGQIVLKKPESNHTVTENTLHCYLLRVNNQIMSVFYGNCIHVLLLKKYATSHTVRLTEFMYVHHMMYVS